MLRRLGHAPLVIMLGFAAAPSPSAQSAGPGGSPAEKLAPAASVLCQLAAPAQQSRRHRSSRPVSNHPIWQRGFNASATEYG